MRTAEEFIARDVSIILESAYNGTSGAKIGGLVIVPSAVALARANAELSKAGYRIVKDGERHIITQIW